MPKIFLYPLPVLALLSVGLQGGCARVLPPPPTTLAPPPEQLAACIARFRAQKSSLNSLYAEARMLVWGPQGRLRGRADFWLLRPDHLRYTLLTPQGGPLFVGACDGKSLRMLDMAHARFTHVPATAQSLDAMLTPLQLHMDPAAWVALLLGEMDVPDNAQAASGTDRDSQALTWVSPAGLLIWARFDLKDGRLQSLTLSRENTQLAHIKFAHRGPSSVPTGLSIELNTAGSQPAMQVEIRFNTMQANPRMAADIFTLAKPNGFVDPNEPL